MSTPIPSYTRKGGSGANCMMVFSFVILSFGSKGQENSGPLSVSGKLPSKGRSKSVNMHW